MPDRNEALNSFEYDAAGNLLSSEIIIIVCSPAPGGAIDPTTERSYGGLCQHIVDGKPCHSKMFREVEQRSMLVCKACGGFFGYRKYETLEVQ